MANSHSIIRLSGDTHTCERLHTHWDQLHIVSKQNEHDRTNIPIFAIVPVHKNVKSLNKLTR